MTAHAGWDARPAHNNRGRLSRSGAKHYAAATATATATATAYTMPGEQVQAVWEGLVWSEPSSVGVLVVTDQRVIVCGSFLG